MIADELKHHFDIALDKKKIHIEHPIRALGEHEVELHLHADVKGTLKVRVESLTPIVAPVEAPVDAKKGEVRTEKRSRRNEQKVYTDRRTDAEKPPRAPKGEKTAKAAKAE
jgi:large subunit ribosomal protein L9